MKRRRGALLDGRALTNLLTALIAISFYLVVSNLSAVRGHLQNLVGVLKPFVIGFAIAFLLNAPMRLFEQKVFYKLKCRQGLSILAVVLFQGQAMAIKNVDWVGAGLFAAAFFALRRLKWNPILVMSLCGGAGALVNLFIVSQ